MKVMRHKNLNTSQLYIDSLREGRWEAVEEIRKELQLPNFVETPIPIPPPHDTSSPEESPASEKEGLPEAPPTPADSVKEDPESEWWED